MYAILISAALAIYSIILVDFSVLYQEITLNNDLLTSTQALYTAEGAIENTLALVGDQDLTVSNLEFLDEDKASGNESMQQFLEFNEGIDSFYLKRRLSLDDPSLDTLDATHEHNRVVYSAYLTDGQALDQKAYYGLEPRKAKGFVIREVDLESNFNEIVFDFNQGADDSEIVFDIFEFPREGTEVSFSDFQTLRLDPESNQIKRVAINTTDSSFSGIAHELNLPLSVDVREISGTYKKRLTIAGFQPLQFNYILYFQALDNQPIHYKLAASYQGELVVLPNMMQTIDVIGATPSGLYSRVKFQRQSEEALMPGLNFVHFTDESLIK